MPARIPRCASGATGRPGPTGRCLLLVATGLAALVARRPRAAVPGTPPRLPFAGRRAALAAGFAGLSAAPRAAEASGEALEPSPVLRTLSGLAYALLKPIYALEAPLQAGDYDKAAVRARIERDAGSSPVVIYSYTLSPFCSQAKELLDSLGVRYTAIELAPEWLPGMMSAEGAAVRAELGAMTGQTSMPHIFIGGRSVGGMFTGTPGLVPLLESGELQAQLKAAGAL
mmetsp:Transcript_82249/g.254277  ORF Transcript_82249/g.254277 Transcript_82249/m.254277 type:complete len:228 (-) Transcript_82249:37-720(-)